MIQSTNQPTTTTTIFSYVDCTSSHLIVIHKNQILLKSLILGFLKKKIKMQSKNRFDKFPWNLGFGQKSDFFQKVLN
ncbi:unnamed protein product [Wickerhamomyces anomalus]